MLVTERDAEVGRELEEAQAEGLAPERRPGEAGVKLSRHAEFRRLVLDVTKILLRIAAHAASLTPRKSTETSTPRAPELLEPIEPFRSRQGRFDGPSGLAPYPQDVDGQQVGDSPIAPSQL